MGPNSLSFVIFIHEMGHLLAAKWSGIGVSEFSVGMGPKLTGFLYGDTQYNLRLFPLGGFVKLAGLDDTDDQFDETMFFQNRPLLHRVITISAGSIMNVFLGFVIFVGIVKGCRDGFAALQGVSAMAPFNAKHCKFSVFGQSRSSCLRFGGKQVH